MKRFALTILVFFPVLLLAQTDSSLIFNEFFNKLPKVNYDTAYNEAKPFSLLYLKSFLSLHRDNISFIKPGESSAEMDNGYSDFSKEEFNSGFSKTELLAYHKNKDLMRKILQEKFDERWWYRVKSLGQLIGVPDWIIKILQFSLLLL